MALLAIGAISMISCSSSDEPENGTNNTTFTLTDSDLNNHLPRVGNLTLEQEAENQYLQITDGGNDRWIWVFPAEGAARYFSNYLAIFELPGRGGEYTFSISKKTDKESIKLYLYDNVDRNLLGDKSWTTNLRTTILMIAASETAGMVELENTLNETDKATYGNIVATDLDLNTGSVYTLKGTKYFFPENHTGKTRIFRFSVPELRELSFNAGEKIMCYIDYYFLQYPY